MKSPSPLKSIDFVFETGLRLVQEQLKTIDGLDIKIGVLWGLLSAITIASLGGVASRQLEFRHDFLLYIFLCGVVFLGVGAVMAFRAFYPRDFGLPGVNYGSMVETVRTQFAESEENVVKDSFLVVIVDAYRINKDLLQKKGASLRGALWFSFGGVFFEAVSLVIEILGSNGEAWKI